MSVIGTSLCWGLADHARSAERKKGAPNFKSLLMWCGAPRQKRLAVPRDVCGVHESCPESYVHTVRHAKSVGSDVNGTQLWIRGGSGIVVTSG